MLYIHAIHPHLLQKAALLKTGAETLETMVMETEGG